MYNYQGLLKLLKQYNLKKSDLVKKLNISSKTIAKISKNEKISNLVIKRLCDFFTCSEDRIYSLDSNNSILDRLIFEKEHKISGCLYHELQIRMTYNSNHIEGNSLSEEQTRSIFETNTIYSSNIISINDITETINHFKAIDYCIDKAKQPLSEEFIKHLHYLIKTRTKDETNYWFNVGNYKNHSNFISGLKTTKPEDVSKEMNKLISSYNKKQHISFEDIVDFHYQFESIHPFQDGNGRVGRLIAFKECLKNNLVPFIIEDKNKLFYYKGLKEYSNDPKYLIDTCYEGQNIIKALLDYLMITNNK